MLDIYVHYSKFFAALFAVMNPLTVVPIYLAITDGKTAKDKVKVAVTAGTTVLIALLSFALVGEQLLGFFGVSINAFRTAGGIIILLMAISMLHAKSSRIHSADEEHTESAEKDNPGVFPLGIPLLAGPGAITTVIIYSSHGQHSSVLASGLVILAMSLLIFLTLFLANRLGTLLGVTGLNIITRLMGMLLAAIGVEMIIDGGLAMAKAFLGTP